MHVVILGNGISGITAARFIRKLSDHQVTVVSKETDYFYSRTALMYIYMGHMRYQDTQPYEPWFWSKNRIDLVRGEVTEIDFAAKQLIFSKVKFSDSEMPAPPSTLSYDKLVLACGSASNKFGWPGQDLAGVTGLYSFQDLQEMEDGSPDLERAVIVGGGLIGIEMAEMYHSRHIPVTFLVREQNYWDMVLPLEESKMVSRHILDHGIDLRLETELKEIIDNGKGEVGGVMTNRDEQINCGMVGLTAGVHPNIRWIKGDTLQIGKGVLVNDYLETNIEDVYAIGDCAQMHTPKEGRRPIEAVWYTGRMMGEVVAHNICGHSIAYDPGIWFNSAKFMDIEYQVYGQVPANPEEGLESVYWEHPDGKKSIRLVYESSSQIIRGFNLMGVRFRHEVCEKWIKERTSLPMVVKDLGLANFDPEFYQQYHQNLVRVYNEQTSSQIPAGGDHSYNRVFEFLNR